MFFAVGQCGILPVVGLQGSRLVTPRPTDNAEPTTSPHLTAPGTAHPHPKPPRPHPRGLRPNTNPQPERRTPPRPQHKTRGQIRLPGPAVYCLFRHQTLYQPELVSADLRAPHMA